MVGKDKARVYITLPKSLLAKLRDNAKDLDWRVSEYITYICKRFLGLDE